MSEESEVKVGIVRRENGEISVHYTGKQGAVFELLAVLNAQLLLDTTTSPAQYREVFNQLQTDIGRHYSILLLNKMKTTANKQKEDFDFLN